MMFGSLRALFLVDAVDARRTNTHQPNNYPTAIDTSQGTRTDGQCMYAFSSTTANEGDCVLSRRLAA